MRLLVLAFAIVAAPALGRDIPLTAKTIDGQHFSLIDCRDHVIIVNFWATWCVPCRAEMPALDRFYRTYRGEGLDMIAVSLDRGVTRARLAKVTSHFAFPIARIDDTHLNRASIPTALPATLVYDRGGQLRFTSKAGEPVDDAMLERIVTPLLKERVTTR